MMIIISIRKASLFLSARYFTS